ncbi:MAG: hypothetical protein GY694_03180 [Gammaproteobacteria bacterium]|nr:hypothetical protein [Gammaproteobacteria bacterium]
MIKLIISIILLSGIIGSYYLLGSSIGKAVTMPDNTLEFSGDISEIRKLQAFNTYEDIAMRPLFDADREPVKIKAKKKTVQKKQVKQDLLVKALGMAVAGDSILAVLKDMKTGKIHRMRINETINGWALNSVSANIFVFSKGGTEKAITFKNNQN